MRFLRWLSRLPGRINRKLEQTALASAAVQSETMGGTQVDPGAMNAALGEMEREQGS